MVDLSDLNPQQRQAVTHKDGPMLVVAGAGTGKTQVITQRIAWLIESGAAKPTEILALTFTEKAAQEMEDRLYDLIGWQSFQVALMTFHAFGTELLGRYASHIGRSIRGGLLNETQKALLIQQHIERAKLEYYGPQHSLFEFAESVVRYINALQNAGVSPKEYEAFCQKLSRQKTERHQLEIAEERDMARLYQLYDDIKLETGTFDYYDQLALSLEILKQRPNLASKLQREYHYVLVDEYQDTNKVQDDLLRAFIPKSGNIFAVGDDDQAIYGFRGADVANILNFSAHFNLKNPIVLTENYRSGQEILDAAYRLIKHNDPERLEARLKLNKQLKAQCTGSKVDFEPFASGQDEISGVVAAIAAKVKQGQPASDVAVLASSHAPLRTLAKALRAQELPFAISTQTNIFEQPELSQLWYLLEWIGFKASDEAISHVILGPFIGWKAEQLRALVVQSQTELAGLEDILRAEAETGDKPSQSLVKRLDEWRDWASVKPVSQLAHDLVFETGVVDKLIKLAERSDRVVQVFEDLKRLIDQMQDYESVTVLDQTLGGYLETFPKPPVIEVTEAVGDTEGVQLLTVHAAKGLEFNSVFLIGCTQRSWSVGNAGSFTREVPPELKAEEELPPEHEFRRLMYVAVTRAKQELKISCASRTADGRRQPVSRFVIEMFGKEVLEKINDNKEDKLQGILKKLQRNYPLKQYSEGRLPFETSDGWIELGVNDLGNYDFCPFEFYLEKGLGIRQPFGPQLAFGSAIHQAIDSFHKAARRGEKLTAAQLRKVIDEAWSDRGYPTKTATVQAQQLAYQTIERFVKREQSAGRVPVATEAPIRLEIPEAKLRLKGRIDAYFEIPGGIELRDYKTGRGKTDPEKLSKAAKDSFQLRSYALALEQTSGQAPALVTLDYVVTGMVGSAELSVTILNNHRQKLVGLAERIRQRDFAPRSTGVHRCAAFRYYGEEEADEVLTAETNNA